MFEDFLIVSITIHLFIARTTIYTKSQCARESSLRHQEWMKTQVANKAIEFLSSSCALNAGLLYDENFE